MLERAVESVAGLERERAVAEAFRGRVADLPVVIGADVQHDGELTNRLTHPRYGHHLPWTIHTGLILECNPL